MQLEKIIILKQSYGRWNKATDINNNHDIKHMKHQ